MALHGPIQVNGQVIGNWQARRLTPYPDADGTAEYDCAVVMNADDPPKVATFRLRHRYEDGALVLAAMVLAHAAVERSPNATSVEVEYVRRWRQVAGGKAEQSANEVTGVHLQQGGF